MSMSNAKEAPILAWMLYAKFGGVCFEELLMETRPDAIGRMHGIKPPGQLLAVSHRRIPSSAHPGSRRRGITNQCMSRCALPSLVSLPLATKDGPAPAVEVLHIGPQVTDVVMPPVTDMIERSVGQLVETMSEGARAIGQQMSENGYWSSPSYLGSVYGVGQDNPTDPCMRTALHSRGCVH